MANARHRQGGGRRQPRPGKAGWYRIQADDLLHSLQLRHDLKNEVKGLQACLDKILGRYDISAKDKKQIKKCLKDLESATKPIAFGVGGASDNP